MIRHKPASKAQTLRHTESLVTRFAVPRFEIVETPPLKLQTTFKF